MPKRPLLRYHGGKWKLAPWIISHLPVHKIYVEPFGGGGSVLLRKSRSFSEIYNDLDGQIVNVFRVVRDRGADLRDALRLTPFSQVEFRQSYEPAEDPLEQARRTIVRSFQGFSSTSASGENTGFRSSSNRSGASPAHDWANFPDQLPELIERLRGVVIEHRDAIEVMRMHDGLDTVHYVDPPYVHASRNDRKSRGTGTGKAYRFELDDDQHSALAAVLRSLVGAVVVSGYRSPLYDALFDGWQAIERIGFGQTFPDARKPRVEVLWLSPSASAGLRDASRQLALHPDSLVD